MLLPLASLGHSIGQGGDLCPDVTRSWFRDLLAEGERDPGL
jgi:hypothetical protein